MTGIVFCGFLIISTVHSDHIIEGTHFWHSTRYIWPSFIHLLASWEFHISGKLHSHIRISFYFLKIDHDLTAQELTLEQYTHNGMPSVLVS